MVYSVAGAVLGLLGFWDGESYDYSYIIPFYFPEFHFLPLLTLSPYFSLYTTRYDTVTTHLFHRIQRNMLL